MSAVKTIVSGRTIRSSSLAGMAGRQQASFEAVFLPEQGSAQQDMCWGAGRQRAAVGANRPRMNRIPVAGLKRLLIMSGEL